MDRYNFEIKEYRGENPDSLLKLSSIACGKFSESYLKTNFKAVFVKYVQKIDITFYVPLKQISSLYGIVSSESTGFALCRDKIEQSFNEEIDQYIRHMEVPWYKPIIINMKGNVVFDGMKASPIIKRAEIFGKAKCEELNLRNERFESAVDNANYEELKQIIWSDDMTWSDEDKAIINKIKCKIIKAEIISKLNAVKKAVEEENFDSFGSLVSFYGSCYQNDDYIKFVDGKNIVQSISKMLSCKYGTSFGFDHEKGKFYDMYTKIDEE
jgi:hypothetical protein